MFQFSEAISVLMLSLNMQVKLIESPTLLYFCSRRSAPFIVWCSLIACFCCCFCCVDNNPLIWLWHDLLWIATAAIANVDRSRN